MEATNNGSTMNFDLPKDRSSIIKVLGVGGGGSNAVNHMYRQGIKGVDFIICNTDRQALEASPVPNKIQLGITLTEGLGAGSKPEIGRESARESAQDLKNLLGSNTKMLFITAGMGGGTGTGAAPVIAQIAKEMGILTVGIVTMPFSFEGAKRLNQAKEGLEEIKKHVDTLLLVRNDRLREIYGNLTLSNAYGHADNVLTTAAKSIAEIIVEHYNVNIDFADVRTVMEGSGRAIMGSATASGPDRAQAAVQKALESPLLNDNNIEGAKFILLKIVSGKDEITMDEFDEVTHFVQSAAGGGAEMIIGTGTDEVLDENISVTVIATGFNTADYVPDKTIETKRVVNLLQDPGPEPFTYNSLQPEPKVESPRNTIITEPTSEWSDPLEPVLKNTNEPAPSFKEPEITPKEPTMAPQRSIFDMDDTPSTSKQDVVRYTLNMDEDTEAPAKIDNPAIERTVMPRSAAAYDEQPPVQNNYDNVAQVAPEQNNDLSERLRRSQEKLMELRRLSYSPKKEIKDELPLSELEQRPAFERRNIKLDQVPPSSQSTISRYTVGENDNQRPEIRPNNPYLHDNVD